uniref:Protein kinase domain-containing protein n=1 Tax=Oryza brachyantha TaxID=4533 RepID=J3LG24_ORYBR
MAMAKLRERTQLRLSVLASPPFFPNQEHGGLPSTPPAQAASCVTELEMLSVLGRGAGGTAGVHLRVAAAAPDHPSVVRLHGVSVGNPVAGNRFVYLVLEYLPEGSLSDVLRRGPLPEGAIATVARCVLGGLSHLHHLGVAHGDVKPVQPPRRPPRRGQDRRLRRQPPRHERNPPPSLSRHVLRLRLRLRNPPASRHVGGSAYMSPERLHPEGFGATAPSPGVDFPSAVWSLGVVLLERHTGRFPLVAAGERPDWPALVLAVCFAGAPELPAAASPEFSGFVRRCLEKDWRRRATVEELLGHPFVAGKPSRCGANEWLTSFHDKTGQVNTSICGEDEIEV